jgi:acetyltransferase-like isoleucine patch superfamily enzyme
MKNDELHIEIDHKKILQERIANIAYPFFVYFNRVYGFVYNFFRLQGIFYGINRAKIRAKIGHLGEYSDISPNVIIKYPENLIIGKRSSISPSSFVDAGGGVEIGDFVLISHMVSINSMSHPTIPPYHGVIKAKTVIHDHAWIGANSIIKEGIEIGEGAIVAAGAVVTKSVPAWTIVAGVPAKHVRNIDRSIIK